MQAADWFERLSTRRDRARQERQRFERSPLARRVLDLGRLSRMLEQMPEHGGRTFDEIGLYRQVFEPALTMGHFLCWFESSG